MKRFYGHYLVVGVSRSQNSFGRAVAEEITRRGGTPVMVYHSGPDKKANQRKKAKLRAFAREIGADPELVFGWDVRDEAQGKAMFEEIREKVLLLYGMVHAVAYTDKDEMAGNTLDITEENFTNTMMVSVFSFKTMVKLGLPFMKKGSAIVTMTYQEGAERVVDGYSTMGIAKAALRRLVLQLASELGPEGIRVNALSTSPIRTIAARGGIGNFNGLQKASALASCLNRNTDLSEVGKLTCFLLSDDASAFTGETLNGDCGTFNVRANPRVMDAFEKNPD